MNKFSFAFMVLVLKAVHGLQPLPVLPLDFKCPDSMAIQLVAEVSVGASNVMQDPESRTDVCDRLKEVHRLAAPKLASLCLSGVNEIRKFQDVITLMFASYVRQPSILDEKHWCPIIQEIMAGDRKLLTATPKCTVPELRLRLIRMLNCIGDTLRGPPSQVGFALPTNCDKFYKLTNHCLFPVSDCYNNAELRNMKSLDEEFWEMWFMQVLDSNFSMDEC